MSATRTSYDGGAYGAAPSKGNPTRVDSASGWIGSIQFQRDASTDYDAYGRPTSSTDAKNRTTSVAYTPSTGVPQTVATTNPLGHTSTTHSSKAWGNPTRETDVAGGHTDTTYDALGRITAVWGPDRNKASQSAHATFAYNVSTSRANTVTTKRLNPAGEYVTSVAFYDGLMRERATQSPSANVDGGRLITETDYDDRGWVRAKKGPYYTTGAVDTTLVSAAENQIDSYTIYEYDQAGRTTKESLASLGGIKWSTITSHEGDRTRVTPPTGGTGTVTVHDVQGRTTSLHQFLAGSSGTNDTTTYGYTPAGLLATITDPSGTKWTKTYDIRGRLVSDADPDKGTTTYTYDELDQQVTSTDARNVTLWTGYDPLGRKTQLRDDTQDGTLRAEWTYDTVRTGSLTSSTRHANGQQYVNETTAYDIAGRPTASKVHIPENEGLLHMDGGHDFGFEYNPDGSVKVAKQPAVWGITNEDLRYTYDTLGNVKTFRGIGHFVSDTYRRSTGEVMQYNLGSVAGKMAYASNEYDPATSRLTRQTYSLQGTATTNRQDLRYTHDQAGNITRIADMAAADTRRECFTYDYLRRLKSAWTTTTTTCAGPTDTNIGSQAPYVDTYTYAKNGNRTSVVSKRKPSTTIVNRTDTTTYPAATAARPHAATQMARTGTGASTETYTYDATGNMTRRSKTATNGKAYEWDREGRVKKITDLATNKTIEYLYDADGNRLIERDNTDGPGGSVTMYLGTAEITVKDGVRSTVRTYTLDDVPVATRDKNGIQLIGANHQNTPTITSNASTQAWTKRRFSPFGEQLQNPTTPWPSERGFLNKQTDTSPGTVHLDAREYDPTTGRFLSVDPIADFTDPQQINGYAYANNTPVTMMDPDGRLLTCSDHGHCGSTKKVRTVTGKGGAYIAGGGRRTQGRYQPQRGSSAGTISESSRSLNRQRTTYGPNHASTRRLQALHTQLVQAIRRQDSPGYVQPPSLLDVVRFATLDERPCAAGEALGCALEVAMVIPILKFGKPLKHLDDAQYVKARPDFEPTPGRGGQPGSRPGLPLTRAGKDETLQRNAVQQSDGIARCANPNCAVKLEVPRQSQRGVTPSPNEAAGDHIIPQSLGGSGDPSNAQGLCRTCNRKKSNGPAPW